MKLVADASNWHRWWSMRLGAMSGACFAAAGVYVAMSGMAPKLVAGVPQIILTGIVCTAMAFGAAGYLARPLAQKNLQDKQS